MGLLPGDLEKVSKDMSVKECYVRIYTWHKKYGKKKIKEKQLQEAHAKRYSKLLDDLPTPQKATESDMNFVFGEVIYGLMEWSYHEEDAFGIKIAAYATFARAQMRKSEEKRIHPMNNVDPNALPEKMLVEDVSLTDLLQLAEVVFADVEVTEQIGGRVLLFSFCLERNSHILEAKQGDFTFYNASALGLKYLIRPNSLVDHIRRGTVRVSEAIAEPLSKEGDS